MSDKLEQPERAAVAGRRESFRWRTRAFNTAGNQAAMGASDKVRFKLATTAGASVPLIDIVDGTPSASGSNITISDRGSTTTHAEGILELHRGDTATLSGRYYYEIDRDDSADANRTVQPIRGTIVFKPSMGGSIGG